MNHRRVLGFFGFIAVLALLWPAVSPADHVSLTATVSAPTAGSGASGRS